MKDTVKVTAMLPRELWASLRQAAVMQGTSARELLTKAVQHWLRDQKTRSKK
jgi:hypothetical protein